MDNNQSSIRFVFFGSSNFSKYVLEELENADFVPMMTITNAKAPLPELPADTDLSIVASFGKIIPKDYLSKPKYGFINVHPSLLPELRGPSPIQNLILQNKTPGVTIIRMDEKMDHGPILNQKEIDVRPWPDHYAVVEEKLGRAGGKLLVRTLRGEINEQEQDHNKATFVKMIKKEDGLLNLEDEPEKNLRKVLAYSTWPGAHIIFKRKNGEDIRVVIRNAKIIDGNFVPTRVIPAGKKEMDWQDFLRGNA
jgi:methionyl-tRNA formyltransferase